MDIKLEEKSRKMSLKIFLTGLVMISLILIGGLITSLSAISQQNAASSEETRASMQNLSDTMDVLSQKASGLNDIAKVLDEEMSFFRIEADAATV
ncbi:hypothetical protein [Butyrivibrio sp. INlla14]|uniref:hypothetical protein n=1 Tax=Butyrivibrio sp. INlla14 TaxID=1520808 RepID=UPI00087669F8|nr:hypothetical protein [Butyrivibrio sp. INlla14]SCX85099.1 hypothetical protein SAMN02910371_00199 [Butyrivibrio sp. INlla14]